MVLCPPRHYLRGTVVQPAEMVRREKFDVAQSRAECASSMCYSGNLIDRLVQRYRNRQK